MDVALPHDVKVDRALAVLDGDTMVLRLVVRVDPIRRLQTEVDLRRRIKEAFDREAWAPLGAS